MTEIENNENTVSNDTVAENLISKVKKELPETGEYGGPKGLEPTRYGDWEKNGRCIDF
ncbi:MAG: hypothetical protein ACI845_000151 [Gammaproteobacteria bacterium]|jgi:hypothetical protein